MNSHMSAVEAAIGIGDAYRAWVAATSAGDVEQLGLLLDEHWFGTAMDGTTVDIGRLPEFMALTSSGTQVVDPVVLSHGEFHLVRGSLVSAEPDEGTIRFVALWKASRHGPTICLTHHETRVVESAFARKPPTARAEADPMRSNADAITVATFRTMYDDLARAMPAQDLAHLANVIDDSWFTTDPGGQLRDKNEYMDFARTYYAPSLTFGVSELFVRECAPFAIVSCRYTLGGYFGDGVAPNQAVRVTGIWLDRDGSWVYLAQQGSFIP